MVVVCMKSYVSSNSDMDHHFKKYPYELSSFQKYAIEAILKHQHVLVTAHTGSGKTLPAEFAIEHWVAQGKKVIYTSPIKALSNQKFYEFTNKFPHISFGLFTGDIKTNPEANVLIMTTEILMNRLFNQSVENGQLLQFQMDFENELAAVIFDEVHYINDADRGQVWEKSILMLPEHIQMVMLSATLDKPERFAQWIEHHHPSKQVYLCPTNHRVVPLIHYVYITMGEHEFKLIKDKELNKRMRSITKAPLMIRDSTGKFYPNSYDQVKEVGELLEKQKSRIHRKFCLNQLARYLKENTMLPAIGFVFSRKQVELCAQELTTVLLDDDSKIPYTVKREAEQIIRRLPNYEEYLRLPEYTMLISLLEKGIGIHHSGMIPILREIVELCISKKYIQFLFATESFAIGLDCPIKTAVFTGITKFDGDNERTLYSHEYTQMAGRAGRRGIDTIGHVIHCNNLFRALPTQTDYKNLLGGKPPNLISKFKIDYSLILNLLKTTPGGEATVESIVTFIERSMMFEELQVEIEHQRIRLADARACLEQFQSDLIYNQTEETVCNQYREIRQLLNSCQPKKRKQYEKQLDMMAAEHSTIEKDVLVGDKIMDQNRLMEEEIRQYDFLQQYVSKQVLGICEFLQDQGFLSIAGGAGGEGSRGEGSIITASKLGSICSNIAEVHGPIWTTCMIEKWNYFRDFTSKQIVGIISCITDVKIKSEMDISVPTVEDGFLKARLLELKDLYTFYDLEEGKRNIHTGIRYEDSIQFSIVDEVMKWCDCDTEEKCKVFIQEYLVPKEISIGDFTKAILKIATTVKELRGLYELEWCRTQTEWLHKLTVIEEMILKYIATNQSLYV